MIAPANWVEVTQQRLKGITKRPVVVRKHPGNDAPERPLAEDLRDCWAVVIWASSAGVHALVAGIPVVATAPHWILRRAAGRSLEQVESCFWFDSRLPAFRDMAWAQWTVEEIASGAAFRHLLSDPGQAEGAGAL